MILMPFSTRCPACGRFVFSMDDLFAAEPWVGIEEIPKVVTGLYHYDCFRAVPWRDEYLKLDAKTKNGLLDKETDYFVALKRSEKFALALRTAIETYVLYFLPWGRLLEFRGKEEWGLFLAAVVGRDFPQPTPPNSADHLRIRRVQDSWELATRILVPIQADFTPAEVARIRHHLSSRGTDPIRSPVNFGTVCGQLGITPSRISCPLERLIGTCTLPDVPAGTSPAVTLTVRVEKWTTVLLSDGEMQELREFLKKR
jgi:hypothetical protein